MINTIDLAYKAGISDFYKQGKRYGYKAFPPNWMNEEERNEFFRGKKYAITLVLQ